MTYDYIVNPESGRKVSLFSSKGKSILKNYLSQAQLGGAQRGGAQRGGATNSRTQRQRGGVDYDGRCKGLYKTKGSCDSEEDCRESKNRWGPMCTPKKTIRNKRKTTKAPKSPRSPGRPKGSKREYVDDYHHQRYHGTTGASACSEDDTGNKRGAEWCKDHSNACNWVEGKHNKKAHCKAKRGSNSPALMGSTWDDSDFE